MGASRTPQLDRIMQHVVKHKGSGHWEWIGKGRTGTKGEYGGTRLNGRMMSSHRTIWILIKGYVPGDLLHQCDMKLCCNPKHLREGTHQENLKEAVVARGGKGWGFCAGRNRMSKINIADEDTILGRIRGGTTQAILAGEYGVTQACISKVAKRARARE